MSPSPSNSSAAGNPPLLVIVGPTATGKSALALRLAELVQGEIISADSVQIYRHFDIGSAKPSDDERRRAPHHLIDITEPHDALEAAQWAARAEGLLAELRARNVRPILCGGTFLWIRALLYGLAAAPPGDAALRATHLRLAEEFGRSHLHERLAQVDPESAARLHPNDFVRVSRALEVFELTGSKLSTLQAEHGFRVMRHQAHLIGLCHAPAELDQRIQDRCRAMFQAGWVDEVRALLDAGFADTRPMGAVGYRQIRDFLAQDLPWTSVRRAELEETIFRATRVFARRQRTWLRDQSVRWLGPEEATSDSSLRHLLELS